MGAELAVCQEEPIGIRLGHDLWSMRPTLHNGPGWRVAVWVQGCRLRCTTACLNPHYLDPAAGVPFTVGEVLDRVLDISAGAGSTRVEGVTVLGGEPTEQGAAVATLCEGVRAAGLSTMVYSGHTLEVLRAAEALDIHRLLAATDILVDGPFEARAYDPDLVWRGSRNQRILPLSDRYSVADIDRAIAAQGKSYSIKRAADGRISVSGLQSRKAAQSIERLLRGAGA